MKSTIVFESNYNAYLADKYKYIINSGSSRSSKTMSLIQLFWIIAVTKPRTHLAVFRVTKKDCKDTILKDMLKYYPTLNGWESVNFNKTESIFQFPNGSKIFIEGTDDDLKVMGYHSDYLWFNEFYKISKDTFDQLDMRCSGKVFMDYNPVGKHWADEIMKQDNAIVVHSTFKDNPFIPEAQKAKIKSYEPNEYNDQQGTTDNYKWQVFGLGLKAEKPNKVYKGWQTITNSLFDSLPYPSYYGLDFGSSNPSALVEVKYGDGSFFTKELLYKPIKDITEGLPAHLENLGIRKDIPMVCDSADPKRIIDLKKHGFKAVKCYNKSILIGIEKVNSFKNYYTSSSENLEQEYETYEWEIVNGVNLDRPLKKDDHLLDALRYCETYIYFKLNLGK